MDWWWPAFTKIYTTMRAKLIVTIIGLVLGHISNAQYNVDSLVRLRNPDFIDGKVPTYFTRGHKEIALSYQKLITDAINYHEKKYSKTFKVKLAVIDSANWLNEVYPYGFVFYEDGWIGMNTGMSYESFKKIYGLQSYFEQLDKALVKNGISQNQLVNSFLNFYSVHELGHYYITELSNVKPPDNWTNEFIPSYFAYDYFINNKPKEIEPFELFCKIDRDNYLARYTTIKDFNELYSETGLENYVWYHSNFYFLIKNLYQCYKTDFIPTFEVGFNRTSMDNFSTTDIISFLDKKCGGQARQWVTNLESRKQN